MHDVTIHHLEITADVAGQSDDAAFARLFARHIDAWARHRHDESVRGRRLERDRALGDRDADGGERGA